MSDARQKIKLVFPDIERKPEPPPRCCDLCSEMRAGWQFDGFGRDGLKSSICTFCLTGMRRYRSGVALDYRDISMADITALALAGRVLLTLESEIAQRTAQRAA
ncbi:MAG TPA: hypothetical protein VGO34_14795 [Alphaproteobacteria bacterium]|jgi:hypothetical protein